MRVKLDHLCHQFVTQIKSLSDFWDDDTAFTSCFASCFKLINKYILCCVAISFFLWAAQPHRPALVSKSWRHKAGAKTSTFSK